MPYRGFERGQETVVRRAPDAPSVSLADVRIAIVHEWLVTTGGSEWVLKELVHCFPHADLFCLVDDLSSADRTLLGVGRPRTSFLQSLPGGRRSHRALLPLMPWAIESLDLSGYDLVISNSHAVAKGVRSPPGALHLCHCCSPMRYAWDLREQYLREAGLDRGVAGITARWMLDRLQRWDRRSTSRVHGFVAISEYIADRIERAYGRESDVIYPPVDTDFFFPDPAVPREAHYVTASRLVGYKRIPLIVEAFRQLPHHKLTVIGDGPDRARVERAAGPNITILGRCDTGQLRHELRRARAFIFAAEEDFGIAPVEAQACGTPVIAYGRGGARETIVGDGVHATGRFFHEATPDAIAEAVRAFEAAPASRAEDCRANAVRFSVGRFRREILEYVMQRWSIHRANAR